MFPRIFNGTAKYLYVHGLLMYTYERNTAHGCAFIHLSCSLDCLLEKCFLVNIYVRKIFCRESACWKNHHPCVRYSKQKNFPFSTRYSPIEISRARLSSFCFRSQHYPGFSTGPLVDRETPWTPIQGPSGAVRGPRMLPEETPV